MNDFSYKYTAQPQLPEISDVDELMIPYGSAGRFANADALNVLVSWAIFALGVLPFMIAQGIMRECAAQYILCSFILLGWLVRAPFAVRALWNSPTQIQLGPSGIRFHWLCRRSILASPWISWNAFTHVGLVSTGTQRWQKSQSCLQINLSMHDLPWQLKRFFSWTGVSSPRIVLSLDRILHKDDIAAIVSFLRKRLDISQFDEAVLQLDAGAAKVPTFTTLWLDKLSGGGKGSGVRQLAPGTVLEGQGRSYTVERRIGSGGQAVTYAASVVHGETNETEHVVLKEFILPVSGGLEITNKAVENIRKEADLIESLQHSQIVKCLDCFTSDRRAYIVMNFVPGKTLRAIVEESGKMTDSAVLSLASQMCEILAYLHERQPPVVHRDFTPDNLMLRDDGKLELIDFNVAKRVEAQTATQTVVGRHCYIPPEQFQGRTCTQSDLYALGATLYFLYTGSDPQPLTKSTVPHCDNRVLAELIEKSTAQKLADRYVTASEMATALSAGSPARA